MCQQPGDDLSYMYSICIASCHRCIAEGTNLTSNSRVKYLLYQSLICCHVVSVVDNRSDKHGRLDSTIKKQINLIQLWE